MYELIILGLLFAVPFVLFFYWLYRRHGVPRNEIIWVKISNKDNIRHRIVRVKKFHRRRGKLIPNSWFNWYKKHGTVLRRMKLNETLCG